jgi:hypothetical protein
MTQADMLFHIVQRVITGGACNPMHMIQLQQGWARKPPSAKRCSKEITLRRAEWIKQFYESAVHSCTRANEYKASKQSQDDFPDEDEMWMESSALKAHFSAFTKARNIAKAALDAGVNVTVAVATAATAAEAEFHEGIASDSVADIDETEEDVEEVRAKLHELGLWLAEDEQDFLDFQEDTTE